MTVFGQLTTLESSGLILLAQLEPEVEYLFRHALVQEAAYQSLVRIDRRMLHQAVGEALERLYPAGLASPNLTPMLARHFAEAGDQARALRYFTLAGRAAAEMYANAEAIHHFGRALDIATTRAADGEAARDLFLRRGRALELNAQDAEALSNYEAMEAWAVSRGDRGAQLAARNARATIYVKPSVEQDQAKGYDLSQQALGLARELGDRPAEAKVLWNLLQHGIAVGEFAEAVENGERALAIAREQGLREQSAYVLTDLLKAYFQVVQPARAQAALEEARSLWRELGMLNMLADNLASTSMMSIMGGHYDEALAFSDEAALLSRRIGIVWNEAYAYYMVDLIYYERGDIGRAVEVAEAGMRLAAQAGFAEGLNQASFDLALIYGYMGALPRALELARPATGQTGSALASAQMDGLVPLLYVLNGRLAEAQAALDASRFSQEPEALKQQFILAQALFAQVQAELALAQNDPQRALALVGELGLALQQNGMRLFLADVLCLQGRALLAAGRAEEAQSVLQAARAEAETVGSRRSLWEILAALAEFEAGRGDAQAALALRRQAAEIIDYIAEHAGSAELAETFRNRAVVQQVIGNW